MEKDFKRYNPTETHKVIIQLGFKATGKTEYAKTLIKTAKRGLILDCNNEYTEYQIADSEFINNEGVEGIYRVVFDGNDSMEVNREKYCNCACQFRNGTLILEDYSALFKDTTEIKTKLAGIMCFPRTHRRNIVANYQSFKQIHPKALQNVDFFIFCKTYESIKTYKSLRFSNMYHLFLTAENVLLTSDFTRVIIDFGGSGKIIKIE